MSRFVGTKSNSQNGANSFVWVIDTTVSGRTVTASFKIFAKGAYTPYYQWSHTVKCVVGSKTLINGTGNYPNADSDWKAVSETIDGTTYNRCYTLTSGSDSVGNTGGNIACSFSYTVSGSATYLPTTGTKTASGTESVGPVILWNDINAYNPTKSAQNALKFNLTTSDGGSWTDLTNEPSSFSKAYGTTATISNIRSNLTGAHYTTNNITGTGASSFTWTFNTADFAVELNTAWDTYTIAYAPNGGSSTPQSQTKTYGVALNLRPAITRANSNPSGYTVGFSGNGGTYSGNSITATDTITYSFAGWKSSNTSTIYNGEASFSEEGNVTMTAQWGSSTTKGSITLPAASTATRQYYTFSSWNTNSAGTGTNYSGGASYTPSGNTTLYAKWTPNAPINLSLTRNSSTSNSITLTYADEGVVTSRTVYYRKSGTSNYSSMNITTNPFTITGLDIDTNYDIYFKASNDAASSTTTAQQFSTLLINPTISNINYSDLTPFTVNITCSASINPSRTLSYQFSKDGGNTWTLAQSSNTYQWTGLSEETTYSMAVKVSASHTGVNASDTYAQSSIAITTPADQARVRIKVSGNWIVGKGYYKKNGEWIKIKKIYRKVNGEWKIGKNLE